MKKLVIKTVAIVLSIIAGISAITLGALCLTTPKTIAKGFESLGNYSASKYFYEMQYDKTNSIDDLLVLINNAYGQKDKASLEDYLCKLVGHNNFDQYCSDKNEKLPQESMKTEEYYSAFYVSVLYGNGKFDDVIDFCCAYVDAKGYTKNNPFTELIKAKADDLEQNEKDAIKTALEGYLNTISDAEQINLLNQDINELG